MVLFKLSVVIGQYLTMTFPATSEEKYKTFAAMNNPHIQTLVHTPTQTEAHAHTHQQCLDHTNRNILTHERMTAPSHRYKGNKGTQTSLRPMQHVKPAIACWIESPMLYTPTADWSTTDQPTKMLYIYTHTFGSQVQQYTHARTRKHSACGPLRLKN